MEGVEALRETTRGVVQVRDVYHMLRDYSPLYRIRTALKLTAPGADRISQGVFNRVLFPTQLHLYEGLDWKHKSISRKRIGGPQIEGVISYCCVLDHGQKEVANDNHAKISVEALMHLYHCWYIARDESVNALVGTDVGYDSDTTIFGMPPNQFIPKSVASYALSLFRDNLKTRISTFTPQWVGLAEQCELPEERLIKLRL